MNDSLRNIGQMSDPSGCVLCSRRVFDLGSALAKQHLSVGFLFSGNEGTADHIIQNTFFRNWDPWC